MFTGKRFAAPGNSEYLAEFIGIAMGDGGLTNYQVKITLNATDDVEYIKFVANLMQELFNVEPGIYWDKKSNVVDVVISRSLLVQYLHGLGLPIGNKIRQGLDMPQWIRENRKYAISCVRGLIDTDGSVFTHRYVSKGKLYSYKKLSFTSVSKPLLATVHEQLSSWGMRARLGSRHDIRLDSISDMATYFKLVGTHNPKHLRRYMF
jgi:intein/homing endonuclease